MNVVSQARQYVMGVVGLSTEEQNHLKQLLNRGVIIPLAVIGSTVEDLREIITLNPLQSIHAGIILFFIFFGEEINFIPLLADGIYFIFCI